MSNQQQPQQRPKTHLGTIWAGNGRAGDARTQAQAAAAHKPHADYLQRMADRYIREMQERNAPCLAELLPTQGSES